MISCPKSVYLESSALCGSERSYPHFALIGGLRDLCERLSVPLFVPDVAFQEWTRHCRNCVENDLKETSRLLRQLSNLFGPISLEWMKDRKDKTREVEKLLREFLSHSSISIISTPHNIDIEELIHMSVNKVKPFEIKGEKGFRDSVILFTIFEHAKNEQNGPHLLVANDTVYKEPDVTALAEKHDVELVVTSSIQEARSILEEFLEEKIKAEIEAKSLTLKSFLDANTDTITEFLKGIPWPLSFLNRDNRLGSGIMAATLNDIQRVRIISATQIEPAMDFDKQRHSTVSFLSSVSFAFDVIARVRTPPAFHEPKLRAGETYSVFADALKEWTPGVSTAFPTKLVPKTFSETVTIAGSTVLTKLQRGKEKMTEEYRDLRIDEVFTN